MHADWLPGERGERAERSDLGSREGDDPVYSRQSRPSSHAAMTDRTNSPKAAGARSLRGAAALTKPAPRRRGIQSVEIGLRILGALAACGGPAPLSAVAQRGGLSPSQTHRYLSSLVASGMARQQPDTGLYDLGTASIRLGLAALARLDLFALADVAFAELARETGRTCLIAVWGDAGATVVRWYRGAPPVVTSLAIGSIMPLLRSATGQVFFAFGDRATMDAEAVRSLAHDRASAPVDLDAIRRDVQKALGAQVDGSLIPGLRAASAPVFDLQGELAFVATLIATPAFDASADGAAVTALQGACREVTESMGGRWRAGPQKLQGRTLAPRRRTRS